MFSSLTYNGHQIEYRADGFLNATQMCQANNKRVSHWLENQETHEYIEGISTVTGIPASGLVQITKGGAPDKQGTWIHPKLAICLGRWVSVPFAIWCDEHIKTLIETGTTSLPHYTDNWDNPEWQKDRQIGKGKRLTLTDATKAWIARRKAEGIKFTKAQEGKLFAAHSNALNRGVYGRSAQELRDSLGIAKNSLLRDYFPQDELWAIQTVEDAAAWLVHSKDMNPIEAINRVIESIEYTRRFIERHKEPLPPSRTKKLLKAAGQLSLF
jgi:hypothetical protein